MATNLTIVGNLTSNRRSNVSDPHPDYIDAVSVSRFWRLVRKLGPNDCWPWMGDTTKGYGVFVFHGRRVGAHELALSFTTGEKRLPELETCHSCDNPICVNPSHLRFGTHQENVTDMVSRGRQKSASKLTVEQVVQIRERRAMGARQVDLAEQFGISGGLVSMIVRGLRWPNAGGPIEAITITTTKEN